MQLQDKKILTAVGMMSGTSMDGIDVAMISSDGESFLERGGASAFDYSPGFRKKLEQALVDAAKLKHRNRRSGILAEVEIELGQHHAAALGTFMAKLSVKREEIDLIGLHGHTVLHRPHKGLTVQLGDGQQLADTIGIPVVYDMRAQDMAHGGQGAPLVPVYHQALAASLPAAFHNKIPLAFVNIGGISNITYIGPNGELMAFDTGPGNALIDQWVQNHAGIPFDQDGAIAAEGAIIETIVEQYLAESFFEKTVPKSLDRNDFKALDPNMASLEDGARTLAKVSAAAIIKACDHLPEIPKLWIICGGGRKNPSIMADLKSMANKSGGSVISAEQAELNGDALEAEAWAYLAIRSVQGLPLTFPKTTGCRQAVTGGKLTMPAVKNEGGAAS